MQYKCILKTKTKKCFCPGVMVWKSKMATLSSNLKLLVYQIFACEITMELFFYFNFVFSQTYAKIKRIICWTSMCPKSQLYWWSTQGQSCFTYTLAHSNPHHQRTILKWAPDSCHFIYKQLSMCLWKISTLFAPNIATIQWSSVKIIYILI